VGGIEPHTRVVGHGVTPYCDHFVTTFFITKSPPNQLLLFQITT
jgi:hypothetical protein